MLFIIDGHNLFFYLEKRNFFEAASFTKKFDEFIHYFLDLSNNTKHKYTLVLDGQREDHYQKQHKAELVLVYAQKNQTADKCIFNILEEENPDATIVSNDREVAEKAKRRFGKAVYSCQKFMNFIEKINQAPVKETNTDYSKHYLFNYYLNQFSQDKADDDY